MKIAVLAANGRTGQAFVRAALAVGHEVVAGTLGSSPFTTVPNLHVQTCDATKLGDVTSLVTGVDAVVSLIGHVKDSPSEVQTQAMRVVVEAMQQNGVKRLVSLTGTGVRAPDDRISLIDRILNAAISCIDPARVKDGITHAAVIEQTDLDWTIIRVLKLTNAGPKPFALRSHGPTKWFVGRPEVAAAILQVLEQRSFVRELPIIGRP